MTMLCANMVCCASLTFGHAPLTAWHMARADVDRDLDQDVEERAYQFLRSTLIFIARFLDTGVDELAIILEHIFDQRTQPFYVNR
jgi:hypothetical protein